MLETLIGFFKGAKFEMFLKAMAVFGDVIKHLEENYKEDKDAKNALIDAWIQMLQKHKD